MCFCPDSTVKDLSFHIFSQNITFLLTSFNEKALNSLSQKYYK